MQKLLLWSGIGFIALVIIIVAVTLIGRRGKTPTAKPDEEVDLVVWTPIDEPETFKEIIARFEQKNPGIKVKVVKKNLSDYEIESTSALSAGEGPDIWAIPNSYILRHLDKLSFAPEGLMAQNKKDKRTNAQIMKGKYVPLIVNENISDNKVVGVPLYLDTLVLFSNPTLLRKRLREYNKQNIDVDPDLFTLGPSTWNDLVDLTKLYTKKNQSRIELSAIALGRGDNVNQAQDILAVMMQQNGATMASPDGLTATFNLPAPKNTAGSARYYPGTKALEFYTSFSNPKTENYTWDGSFNDSYQSFRDGETAMMLDYSQAARRLKQDAPTLNYQMLPLPQIKGAKAALDMASYFTLTVPKVSPNQNFAWQFIQYFQTDALPSYLADTARPSPYIPKILPDSVLERVDLKNPFRYQTQTAVSWYKGKDPSAVEALFLNMIAQVTDQKISLQNAIDAAAQKASELYRSREGLVTLPSTKTEKPTE